MSNHASFYFQDLIGGLTVHQVQCLNPSFQVTPVW